MTISNEFFLIFLSTVVVTRLFLYFKPTPAPTIKGFRTHHWMYGILGLFIGFITHYLPLYAIGLGLFVDELTYLLIGGKNHEDNYSAISLIGTIIFVVLAFFSRNFLISFIPLF